MPLAANPSQLFADWQADPQSSILPDFSHAGFGEGDQLPPVVPETALPVFHVGAFGAVPDDGISDRMAIQQAIDAAAFGGGGMVKFAAGTYEISASNDRSFYPLFVRSSNNILCGEDPNIGETVIYNPNLARQQIGWVASWAILNVVAPDVWGYEITYGDGEGQPPMTHFHPYQSTTDAPTDEVKNAFRHFDINPASILATLTVDAGIKSTSATVDQPESFAVGDIVTIVMRSPDAAPKLMAPCPVGGFDYLTWPEANFVRQLLTIESVSGNTITFREELRWDYDVAFDVVFIPWHRIENVGVENLTFESNTRFDPIVEKWKPNATNAIKMTNVRNGWVRNVTAINFSGFGGPTQSKNVTLVDCRLRVTQEGPLDFGGSGFHNSFKFLGHTTDSLMERCIIEGPTDHGFAIQRHANGNVFLHCEDWFAENELDTHSPIPMVNLYDSLTGAEEGGWGGNLGTQPDAAPFNVFWNWNSTIDSLFWVWEGNGQFQPQMALPIMVGLTSSRRNPPSVQYVPSSFTGVFIDPQARIVAESIGQNVTPESLYLAQIEHRRGQPRETGIFPVIGGPRGIKTGQADQWDASNSTGNNLTFSWRINDGPEINGPTLTHTFTEVGPHEIYLQAVSPTGARNKRTLKVLASDPDGFLIEPLGPETELIGWNTMDAGRIWYGWTNPTRFGNPMYPDGRIGFINADQNTGAPTGGYLLTRLPDDGVDISNANYAIETDFNITKNSPLFRILISDTDGDWAMSTSQLSDGSNSGSVSNLSWSTPHPDFNLQSGTIDLDRINHFGIVLYWASGSFFGNGNDLAHLIGQGVQLTAAGIVPNVAPEVTLTSPESGDLLPFGFTIPLAASATDDDGVVEEVEFLANGIIVVTASAPPFSINWNPAAPDTYTLRARALDNLGAAAESDPVTITVTDENFNPTVALTAPADGASFLLGELINFTATADDVDGTIDRVEFLADGVVVGTDFTFPYAFGWTPTSGGTAVLTARAVDNEAGTAISGSLLVTVIDPANEIPAVVVSHPFDGSSFEFSAEVVIDAGVRDPDSALENVRFLVDGDEIASLTAPPWRGVWKPDGGTYAVTVEATDAENATGVSEAVVVTINASTSQTLEILAEADTYADRGDATPDNSLATNLEVQLNGREAFFRFPLSSAAGLNIVDADFRVVGGNWREQQLNLAVDGWVDSHVTWSNRPERLAAIGPEFTANGTNLLDVTAELLAELAGDGTLSLALSSTTFGVASYRSLESANAAERPRLVVTYLLADTIETFADWQAVTYPGETNPAVIGPDAVNANRGFSNIVTYQTGTTGSDASAVLEASIDSAEWLVRFTRIPLTTGSWLRIEVSENGVDFAPAPVTSKVTGLNSDGHEIVEIRLPFDTERLIGRLAGGLGE